MNPNKNIKNYGRFHAIENTIIVLLDVVIIFLILLAGHFDYNYHVEINDSIVALTIDAVLSVVSIFLSLFAIFWKKDYLDKYEVSAKDYNKIRLISNTNYINALVSSTLLFIAYVMFHLYDLRLMLTITFFIIFALFMYILVCAIFMFARGDDGFVKVVFRRLFKYISKSSQWDKEILNNQDIISEIIKKVINVQLIDKGEHSVEIVFLDCNKIGGHLGSGRLSMFFVRIQSYFLKQINEGKISVLNTSETSLVGYINNFHYYLQLPHCDHLDDKQKEELFSLLVDSFTFIDNLLVQNDASISCVNKFYDCAHTILCRMKVEDPKPFYTPLANVLLSKSSFDGNFWFLEAVVYCLKKYTIPSFHYNLCFILFIQCFIAFISTDETIVSQNIHEQILASGKLLSNYTRQLFIPMTTEIYSFIESETLDQLHLFTQYYKYFETEKMDENDSAITKQKGIFEDIVKFMPSCFVMTYCCCPFVNIYDVLFSMPYTEYYKLKSISSLEESKEKALNIVNVLIDFKIFKEKRTKNMFSYVIESILSYTDRFEKYKQQQNNLGFHEFLSSMDASFSNFGLSSQKDSNLIPIKHGDTYHFYHDLIINKNDIIHISADTNSPFNPDFIINNHLGTYFRVNCSVSPISGYNQDIIDSILKFQPKAKFSPVFNEYFTKNKNKSTKKLSLVPNDYSFLVDKSNDDWFFQEGSINLHASILESKSYLRDFSDADDSFIWSCIKRYYKDKNLLESDSLEIFLNNNKNKLSQNEIFDYIKSNCMMLRIACIYDFAFDSDRILRYPILS